MPDREKVIKGLAECSHSLCQMDCYECPYYTEVKGVHCYLELLRDALNIMKEQKPITGDTSDGYHTFNELYHHRAVLFSVIVRDHKDLAWKSTKHSDGTMYDGMFIVGIETPSGQATYHYDMAYWDMFDCKELETAPEWDGHTPAQAIARIGKLKEQEPRVMTLEELHSDLWIWMEYPGEEEGYGNYIGYAYLEGRMIEDWWFLTAGAKERLVCPLKSYGQVWRCWTSRPTPEQMRDTKWEGDSDAE